MRFNALDMNIDIFRALLVAIGVFILWKFTWGIRQRYPYFLTASPHRKAVEIFFLLLQAVMFAVFFYGMIRFTDAPFHPCELGYCGKTGLPHTGDEYTAFLHWQTSLLIIWSAAFVLFGVRYAFDKEFRTQARFRGPWSRN